jgi:hypothetical protein
LAEEYERHRIVSYLQARFGIPERLLDDYLLFKRKKSWSLLRNTPKVVLASGLKTSYAGMKGFQKIGPFIKPTTRMIQVFGHLATKCALSINTVELAILISGGELSKELGIENGYIILKTNQGQILGLGLFLNGKVRSQMPRKEVRQAMLGYA